MVISIENENEKPNGIFMSFSQLITKTPNDNDDNDNEMAQINRCVHLLRQLCVCVCVCIALISFV